MSCRLGIANEVWRVPRVKSKAVRRVKGLETIGELWKLSINRQKKYERTQWSRSELWSPLAKDRAFICRSSYLPRHIWGRKSHAFKLLMLKNPEVWRFSTPIRVSL
jgi:hypothetical protein